jgi:hypothetical protein
VFVDYPSYRRAKVIIGKEGMCISLCRGISATILFPGIFSSVAYQQKNRAKEREKHKRVSYIDVLNKSTDQQFDKRVVEEE